MDRWDELALHDRVLRGSEDNREAAWEKLLKEFTPMIEHFTPRWLKGADREDWQADLYVWFVAAVRNFDPMRGNKLSGFLYRCLMTVAARTQHYWYAQKRNPNRLEYLDVPVHGGHNTNRLYRGSDDNDVHLIDLLIDRKTAAPDEVAAFREMVLSVESTLGAAEKPAWRALVAAEGDPKSAQQAFGVWPEEMKALRQRLREPVVSERI